MIIENLFYNLNDIMLAYKTSVPYCTPEDGIRFLIPPPTVPTHGMIFVGAFSDWKTACEKNWLYDECTYLIGIEDGTQMALPDIEKEINLFFLNASVQTISQRISNILLRQQPVAKSLSLTRLYQNFWTDIMLLHFTTSEQITARMKDFPFPIHTYIACITVRCSHPRLDNIDILEIEHSLQDFFPNTNLFLYGKEWIILYSQETYATDWIDISYDAFSDLLERYNLDAGISYISRFPELLHTLYLTASASVNLGKGLAIAPFERRIYTYRQYNIYYVIHLCAQRFIELHKTENLVYLTHPDITKLYYYDQENKNNLLDVLFTYLSCEKNITRTAKQLYMHRNTVLNKLKKIESVLQHAPNYGSDHFLLLLSCMIMKYQYTYTQRTIEDCFTSHPPKDNGSLPAQKTPSEE